MFDEAWVINLDRRADRWSRWSRWSEALRSLRFFPTPRRFSGVDGRRGAPPPRGWRATAGAWGCFQSHLRLWRDAIARGVRSVLVFEDDALLCDDFDAAAAQFAYSTPGDWDMVYFGGQHNRPPRPINAHVVQCEGVLRTHAYGVCGELLRTLPGLLADSNTHVDVRLSELHAYWHVYAPTRWLVGQCGGTSDVLGTRPHRVVERWWSSDEAMRAEREGTGANDEVHLFQEPVCQ